MKAPKVSIIIPNYNHASFLRRRFESVLDQTFQDFEIIYLDDASDDHSNEIFSAFAHDPRIRAINNKVNSGVPGKQWNKGVRAANGEYIWIAESDDFADERFLEMLLAEIEKHPTAGLVYCQSWIIDEHDEVVGSYARHTHDFDLTRWSENYFNEGKDELNNYLMYKNTIPNASAVLFRRRVYEQAGFADEWIRYCGDWLLWVKMLMISDLFFVAEPLNYHRRHQNSLSYGVLPRVTVGPSPMAWEFMQVPELPFEHELQRWPAKLRYILGRNALRANRPVEARHLFRQSLRLHIYPSTLLFWVASLFGRSVYQGLDGIKGRVPSVGRITMKLSRLFLHRRMSRQPQ